MSQADGIRKFVGDNYIEPARKRGDKTIVIVSGDVHDRMGFFERWPNVCQVLDGKIFHKQFNIKLVSRTGPKQSSTVEYEFQI